MREILFRGKRTDNGEWVEGRLFANDVIVPLGQPFEIEANYIYADDLKGYEVDSETVGQFTGFYDDDGKRIFEHDIVRARKDGELQMEGAVVWGHGSFEIRELLNEEGYCLCLAYCDGMELHKIGNIHDNPELLED